MKGDQVEQNHEQFRAFAVELATDAGAIACEAFGTVTAEQKQDGSLVTEVDEALDRLIGQRIRDRYPDHAVLSEEQCTVYDPSRRFTWVIDPIDGTTNYARGLLIWGISIALLQDGEPIVGVLVFPLLHETLSATAGGGARDRRGTLHASSLAIPEAERFVCSCTRSLKRYRWQTPLKHRILGSTAYHLAKVADGTVMATVEATPKLWDIAAATVIVREAGGTVDALNGAPHFPLPPQPRDYARHSMSLLGAANEGIREHIRAAMTPMDMTTRK